jgi:hypothetical protein
MSVRSKKAQGAAFATNGSLYSSSIDLKPGVHLPHSESVGITLVDGDKDDGAFMIKMYYGPIMRDPDTLMNVPGASSQEENYLRFRVNYLAGYNSQAIVGMIIRQRVSAALANYQFKQVELSNLAHMGKRVHVCGNEVASYFVQAFIQNKSANAYTPDFASLSKAIAGDVDELKPFAIDNDGHKYTYMVTEVTKSSAMMVVSRVK